MPTRSNPFYVGSGASYGSRGLGSGLYSGGAGNIPTALAQMVGTFADVATYDPALDPRAQQARLAGAQADKLARQTELGQWVGKALPNQAVSFADLASQAASLGAEPEDIGKYGRVLAAVRGPQPGQSMDAYLTQNDPIAMAAGVDPSASFSASTYGERYKPTNVMGPNGPTIARAQDAYGQAPVLGKSEVEGSMLAELAANGALSPRERKNVVGATPLSETVLNYIGPNGESGSAPASQVPTGAGFTAFTGQATGTPDQLGRTTKGGLEKQQLALASFQRTIDALHEMSGDPTNFGLVGMAKDYSAQAIALANNVGLLTGRKYSSVEDVLNDVKIVDEKGAPIPVGALDTTSLGTFDPRVGGLKALANLAAYQALAMLGQEGRGVALPELQMAKGMIGEPQSPTMSKEKFQANLRLFEREIMRQWGLNAGVMSGSTKLTGPTVPGGDFAGSIADAATPGGNRQVLGRTPDGRIVYQGANGPEVD